MKQDEEMWKQFCFVLLHCNIKYRWNGTHIKKPLKEFFKKENTIVRMLKKLHTRPGKVIVYKPTSREQSKNYEPQPLLSHLCMTEPWLTVHWVCW